MDGLATKHGIANLSARFNSIDGRFDGLETRLTSMNTTFIAALVALLVANGGVIAAVILAVT